jgi:hypothetical protein
MFQIMLIGAVMVLGVLTWTLLKQFANDRIQRFTDLRRASSRFVSRGDYVDGRRHLPVVLALGGQAFFYENSDMQASLDLEWIQEVEYEDELTTGQRVGNSRVMRLRCFSQTFEFVLPGDVVAKWQNILPSRRYHRPGTQMLPQLTQGVA